MMKRETTRLPCRVADYLFRENVREHGGVPSSDIGDPIYRQKPANCS